jgi:DNA-binding CsgD family transcriptional regulator
MSKATYLRVEDCRAILRLVGECRDLGDDRDLWRLHLLEQLARLLDADLGDCGEMGGHNTARQTSLGICHWGYENWTSPAVGGELLEMIERDPKIYGSTLAYFQRLGREDGISLSRREFIEDREWYRSTSYQVVNRSLSMDHMVYCWRSLSEGNGNDYSGVILFRELGRSDFSARDRLIVHEVHAAIAPLIGGPLARFNEPSPLDLTPRARQVLQCLLEGDGDKQIAARLELSKFTVNQYTKVVFQHFGVNSRAELLARWIRLGRVSRSPRMS